MLETILALLLLASILALICAHWVQSKSLHQGQATLRERLTLMHQTLDHQNQDVAVEARRAISLANRVPPKTAYLVAIGEYAIPSSDDGGPMIILKRFAWGRHVTLESAEAVERLVFYHKVAPGLLIYCFSDSVVLSDVLVGNMHQNPWNGGEGFFVECSRSIAVGDYLTLRLKSIRL